MLQNEAEWKQELRDHYSTPLDYDHSFKMCGGKPFSLLFVPKLNLGSGLVKGFGEFTAMRSLYVSWTHIEAWTSNAPESRARSESKVREQDWKEIWFHCLAELRWEESNVKTWKWTDDWIRRSFYFMSRYTLHYGRPKPSDLCVFIRQS